MNKRGFSLAAALVAVAFSVLPGTTSLRDAGSLQRRALGMPPSRGSLFRAGSRNRLGHRRQPSTRPPPLADGLPTLEAEPSALELGRRRPHYRPGPAAPAGTRRRFTPAPVGEEEIPELAGNWEMRRNADEVTAPRDTRTWHVFLRQSGAEFSGTILRVDGDTGTLVGRWQKGKLVLSHFAGERPNLFEATRNADGTLAVTLNGNAHYLVVRSGEARAKGIPEPPDPSRYTNVKDPTAPFQFAFPDSTGKWSRIADARLRGKVVILAIGGSWCPNCHDEAPFLTEFYKDYRARGLEIVGLMFENDPDPKVSRPRVQSFIKRYARQYPMLFAGTTQPVADDRRRSRTRCRSSSTSARTRRRSCSAATAASAASTPDSRAPRPAPSTPATSRRCASCSNACSPSRRAKPGPGNGGDGGHRGHIEKRSN